MATQAIVLAIRNECLRSQSTNPKPKVASVMRYHTSGIAETLISAPKTAVNPKIITMKWKWSVLRNLSFCITQQIDR